MQINRWITPYNYTDRNTKPKYIVIHYVGAVSTAKNNASYFASAYRGASAHAFVDENEIWQSVDWEDSSWGVGDSGRGAMKGIVTNSNCINIEMCVKKKASGSWYYEQKTLDNTAWLVQKLMKQYGIPASNVIRHYDVTSKNCPANYTNSSAWANLKNHLINSNQGGMEELSKITSTSRSTVNLPDGKIMQNIVVNGIFNMDKPYGGAYYANLDTIDYGVKFKKVDTFQCNAIGLGLVKASFKQPGFSDTGDIGFIESPRQLEGLYASIYITVVGTPE